MYFTKIFFNSGSWRRDNSLVDSGKLNLNWLKGKQRSRFIL